MFGAGGSRQFNGLDQKLYEKMTASIKERKTSYYKTVKTTSEKTKKLSLKTKKNNWKSSLRENIVQLKENVKLKA